MNTYIEVLRHIADIIKGSQFENHVFAVGGCVRDHLRGVDPHDIDLCIDLPGGGIHLAEFLSRKNVLNGDPVLFERFGTSAVRLSKFPDLQIEMVQTRKEKYTPGSRKPECCFGSIHDDSMRRDLTINALYMDVNTLEILDPTGRGHDDFKNHRIDTTGNPAEIFTEDPLRILRVVRFAHKFGPGWAINPEVIYAMKVTSRMLSNISKERIVDELTKMFTGDPKNIRSIIKMMQECRLIQECFPVLLREQPAMYCAWQLAIDDMVSGKLRIRDLEFEPGISDHDKVVRVLAFLFSLVKIQNSDYIPETFAHLLSELHWPSAVVRDIDKILLEYEHSMYMVMMSQATKSPLYPEMHQLQYTLGSSKMYNNYKCVMRAIWDELFIRLTGAVSFDKLFSEESETPEHCRGYNLDKHMFTGDDVMCMTGLPQGPIIGEIVKGINMKRLTLQDPNDPNGCKEIFEQICNKHTKYPKPWTNLI